jgi:Domain of unknown function (DUF4928)
LQNSVSTQIPSVYEPDATACAHINRLLLSAEAVGKADLFAKHLVGAVLALRFPELSIPDQQVARGRCPHETADYATGDCAFHAVGTLHFAQIEGWAAGNGRGQRAYLLVPERVAIGVKLLISDTNTRLITVQSIEEFVGQNIDEIAGYTRDGMRNTLVELLQHYNKRVDTHERDASLLIAIPQNMLLATV